MGKQNKDYLSAEFLIGTFALKRGKKCAILDDLMQTKGNISPEHQKLLEERRELLDMEGDFWNEEELKMYFLAFLFYCAEMNEPEKIKIFYERSLSETFEDIKISVKCDCLAAKPFGIGRPQNPYFFLQEFKKQKDAGDAEGQMLAAMLIAQKMNDNGKPIYGCFLQGKGFTFTTLHDKNYCLSATLDATKKTDLHQIIYILQRLKEIILTELL